MSSCDKRKTYVLVKLTDSALNAIENHLTSNLPPPTISFKPKQNEGVLNFPNLDHGFTFNLSSVDAGGPQGSFECLKQSKCGFENLGTINYKMQIHANEDVYERTKVRMTENQIQSKKYCINHIGATKVKKIAQGGGNNNNNNNNQRPDPSSSSNPAIIKRSIRERVVHLLALRPFKKPELLAKLNKDGIKDKDKKQLSQVFASVAKLKDNAFNLSPHAWNEVRVSDWPFYTTEQREIVRRRKDIEVQKRLTTVNNSINNHNNHNNNNNTNNSSSVSKRSAENNLGWSVDKKQRLSEPFTNNTNSINTNTNNTNSHNNHNHNHNHTNHNNHTNNNTNNTNNTTTTTNNNNNHNNNNANYTSNFKTVPCDILKDWSIKPTSTPNSSPDSGTGSDGNLSFKSSTNFELPDYATRYVEITTSDQLKRYKDEFNREYKEYRRLHRDIDLVAKKFSSYELKLKSLPEGSDEWNRTLAEVFAEYDKIKKDFKYLESKQRAHYLHKKLSHIKKLIQEFNKCNSLSVY